MMSARVRAYVSAVSVLLVSGIVCHLLAGNSEQLEAAAARVALVPSVVGDWRGHDESADAAAFEQTGARGYWMRTYVNQRSKASVLAILMCGRPGKMAVHTPEVCYSGAGYELQAEPAALALSEASGQMWTAQFSKKAALTTNLRLYWAWNARGIWEASPSPRWQFRGEPFLYKLYVSHEVGAQPSLAAQADPTADFLHQFVPVMRKVLFPVEGN